MKKRKKKGQVGLIFILIIIVLIIGIAIGYLIQDSGKQSLKEEKTSSEVVESADVKEDQSEEMVIQTEYGDLYYPGQWEEYLKTEQTMDNDSLQVSFSAHLGDKNYPMFQVTIGDSEDTEVGELTDSSGTKRTVHMKVTELEGLEELSETDQHQLYAMQEELNYVIDNLE